MLKKQSFVLFLLIAGLFLGGCSAEKTQIAAQGKVDFNRQIRPIFTQNCTGCHGGVKSASGVSFVYREGALRTGDSKKRTIVPGHPEQSEIIARITSTDPFYRMPKPDHGPPLSKEQIAVIRQWISEGAEWAEHWAFVAPKPETVPEISDEAWNKSPIDRFIRARLDREKLTPSPQADRATLLRRLSFDLVGLPPTSSELADFIADSRPDAYERQVDRLLASPHYGERWATLWLDLSRYADTRGYEKDSERSAWKYRDWLITALNENKPYDQFGIEQLAGDLIPNATLEQRIATTFSRNTQTNDEGGSDDEEFRTASVMDRVATTWSVFNGVTFSCVQCHDHPYDPIRQEEYYRFLAFFNTSKDADYTSEYPNLRIPLDRSRYAEANALRTEADELTRALAAQVQSLARSSEWAPAPIEKAEVKPAAGPFQIKDGEAFSPSTVSTDAAFDYWVDVGRTKAQSVSAVRMEVAPLDAARARYSPEFGFAVNRVEAWRVRLDGSQVPLAFSRFVSDQTDPIEETFFDQPFVPAPRHAPPKRTMKAASERYSPLGNVFAAPGVLAKLSRSGPANLALPKQPPPPGEIPTRFGALPSQDRTRWAVAVLQSPAEFAPGERLRIRVSHGRMIASRPAPARRMRLSLATDAAWTEFGAARKFQAERDRLQEVQRRLAAIPGIDQPVMEELPASETRETRLYVRGNWMDKGDKPLQPGVPHLFPPLPEGAPLNRLTLAKWFFSDKQPLTARAAVNRYWEQIFGIGIVETLEDYGSVGEPPSHPELLDWLARHFQFDLAWNVKALLREIVTSQAYRQSARVSPALFERDPRNRLLARGPRNRLTAEMVRDQALLASGLLSPKMYGEPVMPYQPPGVWASPYNGKDWKESEGANTHRRAVYTFWKRTSAYPSFLSFDASSRDICTLRRVSTNTPLQALVTLNDPVYDEAAKALARSMRARTAGSSDIGEGLAEGWLRVTDRRPTDLEIGALVRLYEDARKLTAGERDPDFSALTAVASALLNLDAALTK
ncbi:MAG: PSD1 domain-containing protein [Opitutaceae bacterium]|nr:PSD1 domain-containing protein [Opitutaceae bacterium]